MHHACLGSVLAMCSLAVVTIASPAAAKARHHHSRNVALHKNHSSKSHHALAWRHVRSRHAYGRRQAALQNQTASMTAASADRFGLAAESGAEQANAAPVAQSAPAARGSVARKSAARASAPRGLAAYASVPRGFASPSRTSDIVTEARRYIGTNPTHRSSLWCARFMNFVLAHTGHGGTGSDMARSFAQYGHRISGPQVGSIAVMSRGGRGGHVGVVSGVAPNGNPIIISGNHNRRVEEAVYPRGRIYAYVMPSS